jgi:siroheme synthase-like protein
VVLDVADRRCLVVGAGPVAARKAEGLLVCGARVTAVAPSTGAEMTALAERFPEHLRVESRPYRSPEAGDYDLVLTATGDETVDGDVARDARAGGVWVNSADDAPRCSFVLPAVHREGPVTLAVSTGGASPALAGWLRRRVAGVLGGDVATLASLLEEARRRVQANGRSTESVDWTALLDGDLPALVAAGRIAEARALLAEAIEPAPGDPAP